MSGNLKDHILGELRSLSKVKMGERNAMVVCPFHNDTNPSAGVCLDELGRRAPLGWFRCMGCQESVPWNKYAAAAGLRPWSDEGKTTSDDYIEPIKLHGELFTEDEDEKGFRKELDSLEFSSFKTEEWRGVPTKVLEKLGCRFCYKSENNKFYVWMPVRVLGKLRGYVKAEMEKPGSGRPSYLNAKGGWSNQWGLLFFDKAVKLMQRKGYKTLVLCEGPRDAIRLLRFGIPAIAVLGALNWSDEKRFAFEQVEGLEQIILFMDGDDAGIEATRGIRKNIKGHFVVKTVRLWKYRVPRIDPKTKKQAYKKMPDGSKKLYWDNELDPFTVQKSILRKVKNAL